MDGREFFTGAVDVQPDYVRGSAQFSEWNLSGQFLNGRVAAMFRVAPEGSCWWERQAGELRGIPDRTPQRTSPSYFPDEHHTRDDHDYGDPGAHDQQPMNSCGCLNPSFAQQDPQCNKAHRPEKSSGIGEEGEDGEWEPRLASHKSHEVAEPWEKIPDE